MGKLCKLTIVIAALALLCPPTLFADEHDRHHAQVKITFSPDLIYPGEVISITATVANFDENLIAGELDLKNSNGDKVLDNAVMVKLNSITFTYTYTLPVSAKTGS